ncbi:glutathione S-transferase-like [Ptychodera flava]|uniref:glutathione S-transferase-like n=1 Tax=Ptychodera flava TaxID=63121 RepID=UPI00396AAB93
MPKHRIIYFNARGRAEPSRLVLSAAGVEFEDIRFTSEEWETEKATGKYHFGQLPCMETDGVMLSQSRAIARYLANEYGFAGRTNLEKAKVDIVMDTCEDLLQGMIKIHFEKDDAKKAELTTQYDKKVATTLASLEKMLTDNNGGDGFLVGDGVSLADLSFYSQMEYNLSSPILSSPNLLDSYPKLKALNARVAALPNIAAWLEKRPKTEF